MKIVKTSIDILIQRYGLWRTIHIMLGLLAGVVGLMFALEMILPVRIQNLDSLLLSDANSSLSAITPATANKSDSTELLNAIRPGLFKAATSLQDQPMADKTIEKIKSQLKLQCIMQMGSQPVAYIHIKGVGLKKCAAGESVNDLFTVLNVNKDSVDISIVDHKVTLHL
jgi:hypothetical protein